MKLYLMVFKGAFRGVAMQVMSTRPSPHTLPSLTTTAYETDEDISLREVLDWQNRNMPKSERIKEIDINGN